MLFRWLWWPMKVEAHCLDSPSFLKIITWSTSLKCKFLAFLRSDESEFQGGLAICILSKFECKQHWRAIPGARCQFSPFRHNEESDPERSWQHGQSSLGRGRVSCLDNMYRHVLLGPAALDGHIQSHSCSTGWQSNYYNDKFPSQRAWEPSDKKETMMSNL